MAKKRVVASTARATQSQKKTSASSKSAQSTITNTILLDNSLDIAGASQLRQRLLTVLQEKAPVALDAANIEKVDTAALQVLTAFFKDAEAANVLVQWKQPSDVLKKAARLLGLGPSLHLEAA
jgi:phospholipid transport system transporter-binding protein